MKMKTKFLAVMLSALICVPFILASCNNGDKTKETNNIAEQSDYAFTKEEFEANKSEILLASIDYDSIFGTDDELFKFFNNESIKNGAEIDANFVVDEVDYSLSVAGVSDPMKARVDFIMDEDGDVLGMPVDASLYIDSEQISLASQAFLGETALGLELGSLDEILERLANSDLGKMLEITSVDDLKAALAESGITDEYIKSVTKAFGDYMDKYSDSRSLYKLYEEKILGIVEKTYGNVGEETATVNGTEYEAYTLESKMDTAAIMDIMKAVLDVYKESLKDSSELTKAILAVNPDAASEFDEDMMVSDYEAAFADILNELEKAEIDYTEKVFIDKKTGKYLKSDVVGSVVYEGEKYGITGHEYLVDNGIKAELVVTDGEETANVNVNITAESTDSKYAIIASVDVSTPDNEDTVKIAFGFVWNKQESSYELYIESADDGYSEKMAVTGVLECTADSLTFSVDGIDAGYGVDELPYNRFTIKPAADVEAHANVTDIFDLTQDEIVAYANMFGALAA